MPMPAQRFRSKRGDATVDTAMAEHVNRPDSLLPVLQMVQESNHGFLSKQACGAIADAMAVNDARVFGAASFYSLLSTQPRPAKVIRVCDGPVCMLRGAGPVRAAIESAAPRGEWAAERCSCLGLCDRAPAALRQDEPCGPIPLDRAGDVFNRSACGQSNLYGEALPGEVRVAMARIGKIDPESIDSAIQAGAYQALKSALAGSPAVLLDIVDRSGLRGRGGAGFPSGRKPQMVAHADSPQKYVVCNADESEPGTFKDRVLMEGDPHLLLEGMALAAYAVAASTGIIYVRGEYEWVARRLEHAIAQAGERGWLGEMIQGTDFSFHVHVHRGAGAYICGEESALLESLEGKRGQPRIRPPYPTTHGYQGKPTLINNVETLCLVPPIVSHGAEWFQSLGTADSAGTKIFTVSGCVERPGAFEVPLGITLRQIVEQFAGDTRGGLPFKAALTGGAAGRFVPVSLLDVPMDYHSMAQGVALGSGAVIVLDRSVSIPAMLTWLLHFFEVESCGKCTPCREGTREARMICERFAAGRGNAEDLAELKRLARMLDLTSFCGLGRSVAWPIESAIRHFGDEFATRS
jgi:NADH-quinone oxidoreductase subunit F